ncbi:outer membrane protein assembly factor BamA [Devosia sp.]|uniref:outer membrane protein assembly factor BamA n=1 Tax=Devosia sp. TaxID=1871048 RepID=UPI003BAAFAFB
MTNPIKLTRGVFLALAMLVAAPFAGSGTPLVGVEIAHAETQKLVSSVLFEGNNAFSDAALLAMVNVGARGSYTEQSLASDVESIRLAYAAKGFDKVSVSAKTEASDNGRTRITFVVNEGERTGVAAINFTGNSAIGSGSLKAIIRTHETGLFSWLFRDDTYSQEQLQADSSLIELYYANHGYPDAKVTSAVGEFDTSRSAYFVNFTISEGDRYRFGSVAVETSIPGLNADVLASTIRTGKGETYSYANLNRSQEDMAVEATSQGYAFADVRPRVERDAANGVFNVTYLVDEGARLYVERINITGNTKTRDAVIRRELDFGEGDPFNRTMVQRGKSAIEALGFFKTVNFDMQAGSAPDKVVINIQVEEQSTGDYGLSAGYASDSGLLGEVSVTERNFLGRGQYVKASISASQTGQSYTFSFTEPRFMGLKISSGFDLYHKTTDDGVGARYGTVANGGQIRFGLPVTRDIDVQLMTGIEQKTVSDGNGDSDIVTDGDVFTKEWLGYTATYNGLDNTKHPTEGLYATLTQQYFHGDWDNVSNDFVKSEVKARYYMPLLADANIIGSIKGQAGIINALDGKDITALETFHSASSLVRGFSIMQPLLDPTASSGEGLGYTGYVAASAEIEFPIPVIPESYGIRGSIWADAALIDGSGYLNGHPIDADSIDQKLKASVGASVIWDSPFGPLRGDFAYILNKATDDKTEVFQLTLQQLL